MKTAWKKPALAIAFIVLGSVNAAMAQQAAVTVQKTEGTVETRQTPGAAWAKLGQGDMLPAGAAVRTGPGSACILKWGDGNVMKLQALTSLDISRLEKDPAGKENTEFNVAGGRINAHVGKIKTPGSTFTVKTPAAVADVRGTDLSVQVAEDRTSIFGVTEGEILVKAGAVETIVKKDFVVAVNPDGVAGAPAPMPAEMKREASEQIIEAKHEAGIEKAPEGENKVDEGAIEPPEETETAGEDAATNTGALEAIDTVMANDDITNETETQQEILTGQFEIDIYVAP